MSALAVTLWLALFVGTVVAVSLGISLVTGWSVQHSFLLALAVLSIFTFLTRSGGPSP
jgi:hypothetical protein